MAKEKNLVQGHIAADLKSRLDSKLSDLGFTVGKTVEALVEFWLELPTDLQVQIYTHKASGEPLRAIIDRIVDEKMAAFHAEAPVQEVAAEQPQGQVSRAMHMIKELSPDGSLHIELLSDEDRKAVEEFARLMHPEGKNPTKNQTA